MQKQVYAAVEPGIKTANHLSVKFREHISLPRKMLLLTWVRSLIIRSIFLKRRGWWNAEDESAGKMNGDGSFFIGEEGSEWQGVAPLPPCRKRGRSFENVFRARTTLEFIGVTRGKCRKSFVQTKREKKLGENDKKWGI